MGKWLYLDYKITAEKNDIARPLALEILSPSGESLPYIEPLKYHSDALVGLNLSLLQMPSKQRLTHENYYFLEHLDPHIALKHSRLVNIQNPVEKKHSHSTLSPIHNKTLSTFFESFYSILNHNNKSQQLNLQGLTEIIPLIDNLESSLKKPILFNTSLNITEQLAFDASLLANLLFNLRALVINDYNHQISDPSFESLRVDSVYDYLSKLDSISNDALLYAQFKRLEAQIPSLVAQRLKDAFFNYTSMGVTLIDSVEKSPAYYFSQQDPWDSLNKFQLDWLFGTHAGILYRLREELHGIKQGYHNVFYSDLSPDIKQQNYYWQIHCKLSEQMISSPVAS